MQRLIIGSFTIILLSACTLQEQPPLKLEHVSVDERIWKIQLTGRLLEIELLALCTNTVNQSLSVTARYESDMIASAPITEDGCAYLKPEKYSIFGQKPHVIGITTDDMEGKITVGVLARDPDTNEEIVSEPKILHRPSPLSEKIIQ